MAASARDLIAVDKNVTASDLISRFLLDKRIATSGKTAL
jgi:hypothetical protein